MIAQYTKFLNGLFIIGMGILMILIREPWSNFIIGSQKKLNVKFKKSLSHEKSETHSAKRGLLVGGIGFIILGLYFIVKELTLTFQ